jgi:integrase
MPPIAFEDFTSEVLTLYSTGRYAHGTKVRAAQLLRELGALGVASTADLTTASLARYVASKGAGANPNTVNGYLGFIRTLCNYAVEEGYLGKAPSFRRLWLRGRPMRRNRPRSYEEISRLLAHLIDRTRGDGCRWEDRRLCAASWFFALTAARLMEGLCGHVEDLDMEAGTFHVNYERQKALRLKTRGSDRDIPLPDVLREVLRGWLPHAGPTWLFPGVRREGPWTGGTKPYRAIDHLKRAAKEVGIEQITWHSLRHAYGTAALERWDVPIWVVQRVMGHTDPRTTERYLHLDDSPKIAASVRGIGYRKTG